VICVLANSEPERGGDAIVANRLRRQALNQRFHTFENGSLHQGYLADGQVLTIVLYLEKWDRMERVRGVKSPVMRWNWLTVLAVSSGQTCNRGF
jgi:hypothetical protein